MAQGTPGNQWSGETHPNFDGFSFFLFLNQEQAVAGPLCQAAVLKKLQIFQLTLNFRFEILGRYALIEHNKIEKEPQA